MDKKQREVRRQQEDLAFKRGLLWVLGAAVLECLLALVNRFYINYYPEEWRIAYGFLYTLMALRVVGPIVAVLGLAWMVLRLRKGGGVVLPIGVAALGGALGICAHVTLSLQAIGVSMLFWLVVAWGVLGLVYYIYQREFFLAASGVGLSVLGMWFVRYNHWLEAAAALVGIVLVLAVVVLLKKNSGVLSCVREVRFLPKDAAYGAVLLSCVAALVALVAAMVLGSGVAYYLIFVMLAWLFALFVYYTVKMI